MKIISPTILLDEVKCRANIKRIAEKAKRNNIIFRPHFKTHQSHEIGEWFRQNKVDKIAVSSLKMAVYFAESNWNDITVAFPVNKLEIDTINLLAKKITLNLCVVSPETIVFFNENLKYKINIFIEIDLGYNRSGISFDNNKKTNEIISLISKSKLLDFKGFLVHAGNSYKSKSIEDIKNVYNDCIEKIRKLKSEYNNVFISYGDTPTCSVIEDFKGIDEIRPGNFVFYDYMQCKISACKPDDIAVCVACPIIDIHPERNEIIIYGGAVHFSKDFIFMLDNKTFFYGKVVKLNEKGWEITKNNMYLKSLTQEHGIIHAESQEINSFKIGDVIGILPVHSCLTCNNFSNYITLTGKTISRL
ncbi:MAG: alanine racemase [Bacteroidales bacterium]|nr:alanine racemase [Bacteroidales bacterium]